MVSSSTNHRNRLMQRYRNHSDIEGPDFAGCDGDLRRFHIGQRRTRTSRLRKKTCASTSNLKCETHSGSHRSTRNQRSRSNRSAETRAGDTDNDDEVFPCTRYRNRRMLRWCSSSLSTAPGGPTMTARNWHHVSALECTGTAVGAGKNTVGDAFTRRHGMRSNGGAPDSQRLGFRDAAAASLE